MDKLEELERRLSRLEGKSAPVATGSPVTFIKFDRQPCYGAQPPTLSECEARLAVIADEMKALNEQLGKLRGERERLHSRRDALTR
jgi:hypothetical protein